MTENIPPPPPAFLRRDKVEAQPGWAGALRGVWLLTWKSQLVWRRWPARVALLLVLPFLMLITVLSPESWTQRHALIGHMTPPSFNRFFKRLESAGLGASQEQINGLNQIFRAEYAIVQKDMLDAQSLPDTGARLQREHEAADAGQQRILTRARELLNEKQFERFTKFEKDNRERMEQVISNHHEPWGRTEPFYHWLVDVYFFIILPLACVRGCGALIRDELQADTLGFLVTRPASRARLLIVKFISQLAWLQILLLAETLLLFAVGAGRNIPDLGKLLPLFVGAQFLAVTAWSALGTLLGQFTARYMACAILYGAIVEMGIGRIPTNINVLSLMRHLKTVLSNNEALDNIYGWATDDLGLSICALVIAPILFTAAAAALFSFVEYLPASEMQK